MEKLIMAKEINGAPGEFQVFSYGEVDIEGDPSAFLDEEAMNLIIKTFERRGNDLVIDYEHQTLKDVQAPAAGWIKKLINRGKQGLWAVVDWTAKASELIKNREYRYFSPVFNIRKRDRKIAGLLNIALTNTPKLNNLRPIIAKLNFDKQFDPVTLEVAKIMGNTEEDLILYGVEKNKPPTVDIEESIMNVAKIMGNTKEDIEKYGNFIF